MDFTGAQMILTLKLISTAVSYQDGLRSSSVRPLFLMFTTVLCSEASSMDLTTGPTMAT